MTGQGNTPSLWEALPTLALPALALIFGDGRTRESREKAPSENASARSRPSQFPEELPISIDLLDTKNGFVTAWGSRIP